MKTNKELVVEYAKAFNNLDISYIKNLLIEDFHYASQRVFNEIKSKKEYLNYFDAKLEMIKNSKSKVIAQLGVYKADYCLVINQTGIDENEAVSFLIKTDNGKITRADICIVPTINEIQLLDIIPT